MLTKRHPSLVADDLRVEPVEGGWATSMRLRSPLGDHDRIVLRLHDQASLGDGTPPIDSSATPFVPMLTMLAQAQGLHLRIDEPVDVIAMFGARRAATLMSSWFGWPEITVTGRRRAAPQLPAGGTALFFSRGLDSMYSLLRGTNVADRLIAIDWPDAPLASDGTHAIMRSTVAAAAELGLPLHRVSSNSRQFTDPVIGWDDAVGPTLASFALLLSPIASTVVVAATLPDRFMRPNGTHPDLDPLWSSSRVRIVHDGSHLGRTDKAAAVADEPIVQNWLKVCWERPGDGNCGRCAKCVMTMSNFAVAGRLDAVAARFDAPLTAASVLDVPTLRVARENILEIVDRTPPGDLRDAWTDLLERHTEHV